MAAATFFTIGHAARSLAQLADLLREAGASRLVDVRAFPRSRANPQFNIDTLPTELAPHGIDYHHLEALGGRRSRGLGEASPNGWWSNASFRNYADHTRTEAFGEALQALRVLGSERPAALMCSETLWWRCHRRLIADQLLAAGHPVIHILGEGKRQPAVLTPAARQDAAGRLVYPPDAAAGG